MPDVFNRFGTKYGLVGLSSNSKKRKRTDDGSLVKAKRVKVYEVPDDSPAWNMPIPSGAPSGLYNMSRSNAPEYKFVDRSFGNGQTIGTIVAVPTSPPTFSLLNGLKTGTAAYNRIGAKVCMTSVYIDVKFGLKNVDADPAVDIENVNIPVRFMVVYDKQCNGAQFVASDLLSGFHGLDNTIARDLDTNSFNNLNNRERFVVVIDKRFVLQSNGQSAREIKRYKKLKTSVAYKTGANDGSIADIQSGALWALWWRDQDLAAITPEANSSVVMTGLCRLRYTDE